MATKINKIKKQSYVFAQMNATALVSKNIRNIEENNKKKLLCYCSSSNELLIMSKTKYNTRFLYIFIA